MREHEIPTEVDEVPKHLKKAHKHKPFGIEYFSSWAGGWCHRQWFATAKARDQALVDHEKKIGSSPFTLNRKARKIDRT